MRHLRWLAWCWVACSGCVFPKLEVTDLSSDASLTSGTKTPDASLSDARADAKPTTASGDAQSTPLQQSDAGGQADGAPDDGALDDVTITGPAACMPDQKLCGATCVARNDPSFGCGDTTCDRGGCPDPGPGTLVCNGATCVVGTCGAGSKKCGDKCVDLGDPNYGCGASTCDKMGCPDPGLGGSLACQAGACVISTCASGRKKCGQTCVLISDPAYGCGAASCDKSACPQLGAGATLTCNTGECVIGTCGAGTKKCGGKCVVLTDPTYGCGASSCDATSCPAAAGATLVCKGSTCAIGACGNGTKACGTNCVPADANHGCADPARCTACATNETCVSGACACVPDNVEACKNKACGSAVNNCGKTVPCTDTCSAPSTCGGGGAGPNACGCTASSTACNGVACGSVKNNCNQTVPCPNKCASGTTCGGGGAGPNACGCTPNTSACSAAQCGSVPDGCGNTVSCNKSCPANPPNATYSCQANKCVATCSGMACQGTCCGTPPPNRKFACSGVTCQVLCAEGSSFAQCGAGVHCGTWTFESGDPNLEGWALVPNSVTGGVTGVSVANAPGGHAIDINFTIGANGNGTIAIRTSLCGGPALNLQGNPFSLTYKLLGPPNPEVTVGVGVADYNAASGDSPAGGTAETVGPGASSTLAGNLSGSSDVAVGVTLDVYGPTTGSWSGTVEIAELKIPN